MIACLAKLFLPPSFLHFPTHSVWFLSQVRPFFLVCFLFLSGVCAILLSAAFCGAIHPREFTCSLRDVKVIRRLAHERTIEKLYIHTYITKKWFPYKKKSKLFALLSSSVSRANLSCVVATISPVLLLFLRPSPWNKTLLKSVRVHFAPGSNGRSFPLEYS